MKNLILGAFALLTVLFTSCGGSIKLDQPDTLGTLTKEITDNLKSNATITEIDLHPIHNTLTTEVSSIVIRYKTAEGESRSTHVYITESFDPQDKEYKGSQKDPGRDIKDYDFSIVYSNIAKAAQKVIDAGNTYSGVGLYRIKFNSDPSKDEHTFSIQSKSGSSVQGRNIVTEYYEYDSKADAEGNVTVKGLEE